MAPAAAQAYDNSPLRELTGRCLRPGGEALTRRGLGLCVFAPGSLVLDLGCGPGGSLAVLREAGLRPLGLDHSERLAAEAREYAPTLRADMAALPLADSTLDGIVCECVLSLAEDKEAVLGECVRALRPGGRLLLCDLVRREGRVAADAVSGACHTPDSAACSGAAVPCAAGAEPLSVLSGLLEKSGCRLLAVEDHTKALRELAARIVWHFGSLAAFAALLPGAEPGAESVCNGGKDLGYCLIVAEKM